MNWQISMSLETESRYPEHDKLQAVAGKSQVIGEFIEWLREQGIYLATDDFDKIYPIHQSVETLLASFFEIDLNVIEKEKRQMLDSLRGDGPLGLFDPKFEQGVLVLGVRVIPGPLDLTWDPATRTMTVDRPGN